MCRCDLHAWGLRASRLAAALQTRGQQRGSCEEGRGYAPDPLVADSTRAVMRAFSPSRGQRQCSRKKGIAPSSCRAAGVRGPRQFLSSVLFVDLNTAMQPLPFSRSAHVFAGSQPKLTCKSETDAMALSCFDSSQIFRFIVKPIDAQRQTAERAALVSSNECGRIVTARSGNKCRKPDKYHISRERQRSN